MAQASTEPQHVARIAHIERRLRHADSAVSRLIIAGSGVLNQFKDCMGCDGAQNAALAALEAAIRFAESDANIGSVQESGDDAGGSVLDEDDRGVEF